MDCAACVWEQRDEDEHEHGGRQKAEDDETMLDRTTTTAADLETFIVEYNTMVMYSK